MHDNGFNSYRSACFSHSTRLFTLVNVSVDSNGDGCFQQVQGKLNEKQFFFIEITAAHSCCQLIHHGEWADYDN